MSDFHDSLYRSASQFQDNLLEEAKNFVGSWLSDQDDFEAAVDWLLSDEASELLDSQSGTFAFDMIAYALDAFHNSSEEDEEDSDDSDDSDGSEIYDQVRDFFNC